MKIAFVSQPWDISLPSMGGPSASIDIWIQNVSEHLVKHGHELINYCPGTRWGMRLRKEERAGIQFRAMRGVRIEGRLSKAIQKFLPQSPNPQTPSYLSEWYHRAYTEQVARDLKTQNCDIVHLINFVQFAPVIRRHNPNVQIVLGMQCDWLAQLDKDILSRYLDNVDLVTGCSEHVTAGGRERFERLKNRSFTLYNGVDVSRFHGIEPQADKKVKSIVFVGRTSPEKGLHDLIPAFTKVHERFPDAQLKIIGDDGITAKSFIVDLSSDKHVQDLAKYYDATFMGTSSYPQYLRNLIPENLRDKVIFTGGLPHRQVVQHVQEADVFVLPSLSEAFGMPIVEAMGCEIPCVVTNIGGMKEVVVDGETGYIAPPANPDALADALIRVLENPEAARKMGKAGQERAKKLYAWEAITENLIRYYEMLPLS